MYTCPQVAHASFFNNNSDSFYLCEWFLWWWKVSAVIISCADHGNTKEQEIFFSGLVYNRSSQIGSVVIKFGDRDWPRILVCLPTKISG